jgi:hypothetical protein
MEPGQRAYKALFEHFGGNFSDWNEELERVRVAFAAIEAACVPPLPADVAGLVERLDDLVQVLWAEQGGERRCYTYDESADAQRAMMEAASTIRALVAENERLQETVAVKMWRAANEDLVRSEAKLREAVEVMRAMREEIYALLARYDDHEQSNHPHAYVLLQRVRDFLATMEKHDE